MIDVTIIVPVYNVQGYLEKCLDSLVNQDYDKEKYEIYIIDDCSTDGSAKIIKEYENKYPFITANYLEKNSGVSKARNIGIKESKGNYIMFCDSDDYYEKNAVSVFMNTIKEENADFVTANYYISTENSNIEVDTSIYFSNKHITKQEAIAYMTLTSCSKIIKKELFTKNNVWYPTDIKQCEELTVIPILAYYAQNVILINDYLYHYYQRKSSASNTKAKDNKLEYFDDTFNRFSDMIQSNKYNEEIEFRAIDHLLYGKTLVMLKSKFSRKIIKEHISNFKTRYPNFTKNRYLKKFNKAKRLFIYTLNCKLLIPAKMFALLHERLTG